MLKTVENYCQEHNLKFSTDPNPAKCKTKCLAFLKKERPLPNISLWGNNLPWVQEGIHLGNNFTTKYDGMAKDIIIKRATFISKLCELSQEFSYADPKSLLKINEIYNMHFTGSPIWDLFCPEAVQLEKTWNVSVRKTFGLPFQTHKYFIEEISNMRHLKKTLILRFLSFIKQIKKSPKILPKQLFNLIKNDTNSITGKNIRRILLLTRKPCIEDVNEHDIDELVYEEVGEENQWKVSLLRELIECKTDEMEIEGFTQKECEDLLNYVCIS